MPVLAPMPVVEPVAVADVEALLAAIPPDCELDEPGEDLRKAAIKLTSVDLLGDTPNNFGAAAWPVTARPVRVDRLEPSQDPGPVEKVMDQGIDRNQVSSQFGRTSAAPIRMPDKAMARTLSETP